MRKTPSIYARYFGFSEDPFSPTPDPAFLFESKSYSRAIAWMSYAIEQREMGLVIGEVGSGKTLLSRNLVDSLDADKHRIAWLINPQLSPGNFLKEIFSLLFDAKPKFFKRDVLKELGEGLTELYLKDIFPVIIIDEAQSIPSKAVFDEIRLLNNFQTDKQNLVSIILLGQPELEKRLRHPAYRALVQRFRFTTKLEPLNPDETEVYLQHRLETAGYNGQKLFSQEAARQIYALTNGYPRPINHLATLSLMAAMEDDQAQIQPAAVEAASKGILYLSDLKAEKKRK
ncbi:MAG TPA: ATPase [Candidatus Marinimicrobia bacterium]|nr:ATPase [Candidatus Neomarinimicrobiota bacterium]